MPDKPLNWIVADLEAAEQAARLRGALEGLSSTNVLRDAVNAAVMPALEDAAQMVAAAAAAAGDPMDVIRCAMAEMPPYTAPELSTEAYLSLKRRRAGIPSDPAQAAVQLARLLTAVDPSQLATALRHLADALDELAPMKEGPANDD